MRILIVIAVCLTSICRANKTVVLDSTIDQNGVYFLAIKIGTPPQTLKLPMELGNSICWHDYLFKRHCRYLVVPEVRCGETFPACNQTNVTYFANTNSTTFKVSGVQHEACEGWWMREATDIMTVISHNTTTFLRPTTLRDIILPTVEIGALEKVASNSDKCSFSPYPGIILFDLNQTSLASGDHNILFDLKKDAAIDNYQFSLEYNQTLTLGTSAPPGNDTEFPAFNLSSEGRIIANVDIVVNKLVIEKLRSPLSITLEPNFLWSDNFVKLLPGGNYTSENSSCIWNTSEDCFYCNITKNINYTSFPPMTFYITPNPETTYAYNVPPELYIKNITYLDAVHPPVKQVYFHFSKLLGENTLPGAFLRGRIIGVNLDTVPSTLNMGPVNIKPPTPPHPGPPGPGPDPDPKHDKDYWTTGHIWMVIGIVFGVLALIGIAVLIWWFKFKRANKTPLEEDIFNPTTTEGEKLDDKSEDSAKPRYPF